MLISYYTGQKLVNISQIELTLSIKDYLREPNITSYVDSEGNTITEAYYSTDEEDEDGIVTRHFALRKYMPDNEIPRKYLDISLRKVDDTFFNQYFLECIDELERYRNIFPAIRCSEDYDSSDVEQLIFKYVVGVRVYILYALSRKDEKKAYRIARTYGTNMIVAAISSGLNWMPDELLMKALHDFVRKYKYAEIKALIVAVLSITQEQ
ncbi:MAG: hypothetical protein K6B41_08210 [Butyrivibrio sp.]|nr:hypothetical protein [Butyrivibrio sp.]